MGLFSKKDDPYTASSDSKTCKHPNQSQYNSERPDKTIKVVAYCRNCGMEWS